MGRPEIERSFTDGSKRLEYPRGSAGTTTYSVDIDQDGHFVSATQVLTAANIARARPGMTKDEVRRLLGKPTTVAEYRLKQEHVWSWHWLEDGVNCDAMFNAHFGPDGTVVTTSRPVARRPPLISRPMLARTTNELRLALMDAAALPGAQRARPSADLALRAGPRVERCAGSRTERSLHELRIAAARGGSAAFDGHCAGARRQAGDDDYRRSRAAACVGMCIRTSMGGARTTRSVTGAANARGRCTPPIADASDVAKRKAGRLCRLSSFLSGRVGVFACERPESLVKIRARIAYSASVTNRASSLPSTAA